MSFTIREIEKYSKIQYEVAEWAAERIVYMCKLFSNEAEELSKKIENQKEVFEKEHRNTLTMSKLAFRLKDVRMADIEIVPNLPEYHSVEITQYQLKTSLSHVISHLGLSYINSRDSQATCSCFRMAESMVNYFEKYNLSIVFKNGTPSGFFIEIRTNGVSRPEDSPFYPL